MKSVVIEKKDIIHNVEKIKEYTKKSGKDDNGRNVKIIAVVKSNGYGLDLVTYTKFLIDQGIDFFAVSTVDEAISLRKEGIKEDILMLSCTSIKEDVKKLIENNIILSIGSKENVDVINEVANEETVRVHLKIDTGFGRYGFLYNQTEEMLDIIKNSKNIKIEGTYTHFSVSFYDDDYTYKQFDRFLDVVEFLQKNDINTGMLHVCNSSAFIKFPRMHLNAVRIGSAFLGRVSFSNTLGLKRIGTFETKVSEIKTLPKKYYIGYSNACKTKKETKIAILPVGYIDGVNIVQGRDMFRMRDKLRYIVRDVKDFFKKQAIYATIDGQKCKVLGRVGTHHIICDITGSNIKVGSTAILNIDPRLVDSHITREYRA